MADLITGDTEVSAVKMTLISAIVQRELKAQAVIAGSVMDVSAFAEAGLDAIEFPKATSFTVQKKQSAQSVSAQSITMTVDKLLLDQHGVVQFLIEKKQKKQSRVNLELVGIQRSASALGRTVDSDLITAINAGRKSANDVTFSSALTLANINQMRKTLRVENYPVDAFVLALHPGQEEDMLNISNFIKANEFGSRDGLLNGEVGKIFGAPVIVSNLLTEDECFMWHREAIALGFQAAPEFDSQKDLGNLATRYSMDQLYGYKVLQSGAGIVKCA